MAEAAEESVIGILMGMKEDLGEIRSTTSSLKENMEKHIADDKLVCDRVTALEMRAERERGFFKAWQVIVVLLGTIAGYLVQLVVGYFRSKH